MYTHTLAKWATQLLHCTKVPPRLRGVARWARESKPIRLGDATLRQRHSACSVCWKQRRRALRKTADEQLGRHTNTHTLTSQNVGRDESLVGLSTFGRGGGGGGRIFRGRSLIGGLDVAEAEGQHGNDGERAHLGVCLWGKVARTVDSIMIYRHRTKFGEETNKKMNQLLRGVGTCTSTLAANKTLLRLLMD